ncbi:zinc-binding oxidoreductase, partial [Blastomyces gilchristii SLH14081]
DLAGTIITAPEGSSYVAGDQGYARPNYVRPCCARDYTIAVTSELAHRPSNLSWAESTTMAVSALTAWQALFFQGGPGGPENTANQWKRIFFITAASGGVGLWLVQLAGIAGLHTCASCGSENEQYVRDLGANDVVDYGNKTMDLAIDYFSNENLGDVGGCAVKDSSTFKLEEFEQAFAKVDTRRARGKVVLGVN